MALRILCIWFCCCLLICANAQEKIEPLVQREVEVTADSILPIGTAYTFSPISVWDISIEANPLSTKSNWSTEELKNTAAVDVSEVLQRSSGVTVKSYGNGGLATVSLRGTGAGRSATVWNGMPLIGSTLGLLDYSLLNANLFESIDLRLGGSSLLGSGAIGGGVFLNNFNRLNENEFSVGVKSVVGSFGRFHQGLNFALRKGKWWSTTRLSIDQSENNFTYQIREDLPVKTNSNAARSQLAVMQSVGYKVNGKNDVALHFWAQDNLREIPPTTVQTRSEAKVGDKTLRLQSVWRHEANEKLSFHTVAAASYNQNVFKDPLILVFGDNAFKQLYAKSEAKWSTNSGNFLVGLSNRFTEAVTENYEQTTNQNQFALFAKYFKTINDWDFSVSLREDLIDSDLTPISGDVFLARDFASGLLIKFRVNKHFRAPALNDLYWAPGGNADLVPEDGWGQELSLHYEYRGKWKTGINVYNTNVNNWIQWGLLEESTFFSALNLPKVWSRGVEGFLNGQFGNEYSQFDFQFSYNYNPSTFQFDLRNPSIEKADQVYYTPVHQAVGVVTWTRPQFNISYTHRYQSGVNTLIDPLDGFHLGSFQGRFAFKKANLFCEINNLWDANYRVIERRAMPGRYFNIGLNFEIINKLKK